MNMVLLFMLDVVTLFIHGSKCHSCTK